MKKKVWILFGVILPVLVVIILGFVLFGRKLWDTLSIYQFQVNPAQDIVLNFEDADISIGEWNMDYLEVTYDTVVGPKKELDLEFDGNAITLGNQLDFSDFKHLNIYVPKAAIVTINARNAEVKNVSVRMVNAKYASLRYAHLVDGFVGTGEEIAVRESKFDGSVLFKNQNVSLRECNSGQVVVSTNNSGQNVYAEIREVNGDSFVLETSTDDQFKIDIRDSSLGLLNFDNKSTNGAVNIVNTSIGKIENEAGIPINYLESPHAFLRNALIYGSIILLMTIASAVFLFISRLRYKKQVFSKQG